MLRAVTDGSLESLEEAAKQLATGLKIRGEAWDDRTKWDAANALRLAEDWAASKMQNKFVLDVLAAAIVFCVGLVVFQMGKAQENAQTLALIGAFASVCFRALLGHRNGRLTKLRAVCLDAAESIGLKEQVSTARETGQTMLEQQQRRMAQLQTWAEAAHTRTRIATEGDEEQLELPLDETSPMEDEVDEEG